MAKIRIYDTRKHDFDSLYYQENLQLQILIANLDGQGIDIELVNRNYRQEDFDAVPEMVQLFAEKGHRGFPCLMSDGEIILSGRYPKKEQILELASHDGVFYDLESAREDMSDIN